MRLKPEEVITALFDLNRLVWPLLLTRVLHGLRDRTVYESKAGADLGREHANSRGFQFREGCPSGPACLNFVPRFSCAPICRGATSTTWCCSSTRRSGPQGKTTTSTSKEDDVTVELDDVLFADDATIFTTVEHRVEDERHLGRLLGRAPTSQRPSPRGCVAGRCRPGEAGFYLGAWVTNESPPAVDR